MKKTKFWLELLFGLLLLFLAIFFVHLSASGKVDSDMLTVSYSFAALFFIIGVALLMVAGDCTGRGFPRSYLLDRMEYKKNIESRSEGKGNKYVGLLLSEADEENNFRPSVKFHSIHRNRLLDEDSKMLKELPNTFLVRQAKKKGKTVYHISPTRTNEA